MTATDYPSLDTLLAAAQPVDAEPFDLDQELHELRMGLPGNAGVAAFRIRRKFDRLNATIEARTHTACNLEADATRVDARIAEAAALLSDALLWHNSETDNTAVALQEALALLTGDAS